MQRKIGTRSRNVAEYRLGETKAQVPLWLGLMGVKMERGGGVPRIGSGKAGGKGRKEPGRMLCPPLSYGLLAGRWSPLYTHKRSQVMYRAGTRSTWGCDGTPLNQLAAKLEVRAAKELCKTQRRWDGVVVAAANMLSTCAYRPR